MEFISVSKVKPAQRTPSQLESINIHLWMKCRFKNRMIYSFLLRYFEFYFFIKFESNIFSISFFKSNKWSSIFKSPAKICLNSFFEEPADFYVPIVIENISIPTKTDSYMKFKLSIEPKGGKFCKFASCILGLMIFCSQNNLQVFLRYHD